MGAAYLLDLLTTEKGQFIINYYLELIETSNLAIVIEHQVDKLNKGAKMALYRSPE